MAFDALIMKAVTEELQEELTGAPVQRIYEPAGGGLILHLYSRGSQPGLLFSIDPRYARVHLTYRRLQSRDKPSPFCMLLRKYLAGGRAASFYNPPLERILEISFDPPEGMPPVKLIAEIMGRRSNLVLVDAEDLILGAARTVSWEQNPLRAIMPGELYRPVPPQDKLDPRQMEQGDFTAAMEAKLARGKKPENALLETVAGISPLLARELCHRGGWQEQGPDRDLETLYQKVKELFTAEVNDNLAPVLLPEKKAFAAVRLEHLAEEEQVQYSRPSAMLDQFYSDLIEEDREKQLREQLNSAVKKRLAGLEKKLEQQQEELAEAGNAPRHRLFGELLLTYRHQVTRGADSVTLPDLYQPDQMVTVPLDPSRSVSENAQRHFNRYQKAKKAREKIKKQVRKTRSEIEYCRGLLYTIENSFNTSLEEIRQEMIEAGYLREKGKERRKTKTAAPQPLNFATSAGHTVLVGRNNRQNDHITFKAAARRDTWFHVRNLPGGHVVLKEAPSPPPEEDIEEAAFLAAYFSKGRDSSAVAVDYTEIRHVRRRPGGKPGFVFYENFKTVTANPLDPELRRRFKLP